MRRIGKQLTSVAAAALTCLAGCGGAGKDEAKKFRESLPASGIAIYPAVVREAGGIRHDAAAAESLARALGEAGAEKVVLREEKLRLGGKSSFNQAAMFKASMEAFGAAVKANPPDEEYAAITEYLAGRDGAVGGIHLYVVRRDGSRAFGCLLNSHYREFKRVWPKNTAQATGVLVTWLRDEFPRE